MLLGALLQNWKPIALAVIVAGALIDRAVLVHQRDSARAQVNALTGTAAVLKADNAAMAAAVARQNQAVAALQGQMKAAAQVAAQREAHYAAAAAASMNREIARAGAIRKAPVPPGCAGAIAWGNAQGPELGKW